MSIAPPGYTTDEADPGPGSRPARDPVQYEFKSVQALRGRVGSAKAKWQNQGWELVSENQGALRTELTFRRVKPKTLGDYLLSSVAAFRRVKPKTLSAVLASVALILVAGSVGIVVGKQRGGDTPTPSAAPTTASTATPTTASTTSSTTAPTTASTEPPAEPTVTGTTVDEPLDEAEPSETSMPSERRAKARPRARTRPRARARDGRLFANCDAVRAAGAAPLESGSADYEANPHLDRDGDGFACES